MKKTATAEQREEEKPPAPHRRWLSYREAGAILGVSGEAMRMMVRRGTVPYTQLGKRIFIDRTELERKLESARRYATPDAK